MTGWIHDVSEYTPIDTHRHLTSVHCAYVERKDWETGLCCVLIGRNTNQMGFKEHQDLVCTYSRKKKKQTTKKTFPFEPPNSATERGAFWEFSDANSWISRVIRSRGVCSDWQRCAWTGPSELYIENNGRKIGTSDVTSGPLGSYECISSSLFFELSFYFS